MKLTTLTTDGVEDEFRDGFFISVGSIMSTAFQEAMRDCLAATEKHKDVSLVGLGEAIREDTGLLVLLRPALSKLILRWRGLTQADETTEILYSQDVADQILDAGIGLDLWLFMRGIKQVEAQVAQVEADAEK